MHLDPRALREVYLLPFQMVVRESDPWCMMTGYNKVNGDHCDTSKELLIEIARKEWNWGGPLHERLGRHHFDCVLDQQRTGP